MSVDIYRKFVKKKKVRVFNLKIMICRLMLGLKRCFYIWYRNI